MRLTATGILSLVILVAMFVAMREIMIIWDEPVWDVVDKARTKGGDIIDLEPSSVVIN